MPGEGQGTPATIGARIRQLRGEMSLDALADKAKVSKSHLWETERGRTSPTVEFLEKVAEALGVALRELMPDPQSARKPNVTDLRDRMQQPRRHAAVDREIPVIGQVKGGRGLMAQENWTGEMVLARDPWAEFAFEVRGESMSPAAKPGDLAICRRVDGPEQVADGHMVIATVDGDEAVIKYLAKSHGPNGEPVYVLKSSDDEKFPPIPCSADCHIQAEVMHIQGPASTLHERGARETGNEALVAREESPPWGAGEQALPPAEPPSPVPAPTDAEESTESVLKRVIGQLANALEMREANERLKIERVDSVQAAANLKAQENIEKALADLRTMGPRTSGGQG